MNMQQMVQAMQKAQRLYDKEHKLIEEKEYEFVANGAVKAVVKGTLELIRIEFIDPELLKEDPEMVSDMITIAFNGARDLINKDEEELTAKYQSKASMGMF